MKILIMVTEYISNGNLDDALHNTDVSIPLGTRLGIAVGCAEALSYMHSMHLSNDSLVSVCHGDIKPANILLDANLTAKVADFGLSGSLLGGITQYTKYVKGSLDYMDPIYFQQGRLTPKSDVYSFGAVLLELIARRRVKAGHGNLIGTFSRACAKSRGITELFDAEIANMSNMKILEEVAKLATKCLTLDIDRRPQMNDVVKHLQMLKTRTEGQEKTACPFFWEPQNHNIKNFTEQDIERITSNYSTPIGKGGFGEVYKGVIYDDNTAVAVKRYIKQDLREQFMAEVSIHGQINHKNAVKLIGYCIEGNTLMIVTEYISNGNLDDALHNSDISIPLDTRLAIAIGCAEALSYMHSMHLSNGSLVCHGDIKPANILLDADLTAKVADFGLSRLLSGGVTRYTSMVKGSLNYMDPIYLREGRLTPKSDIYSFGAVLLELIARKRVKEGEVNLIGTFSKACANGEHLRELFDAEIANRTDTKILDEIAKLATECLSLDIDRRPQINYVAEHLRMLQAQMKGQKKSAGPFFQGLQNHDTKIFTEKDIERITSNYSTPIGRGAFGEVYKGFLDDEDDVVAVRRFIRGYLREDFMRQVSIHSQINHKNAGKLIGYCIGENILMTVTEYFSNGNLDDALHNSGIPIPLGTRLGIAIGCAEALSYMHSMHLSNDSFVCHGDIKPANISLDANLIAKVTDFWNAKLLLGGLTFYTSSVIGSVNYMDPIFLREGRITPRSDVYSFGAVLLELIARKRIREVNLIEAFHRACAKGKGFDRLFDADITNMGNVKILEDIAKLATKCLTLEIDRRPQMKDVEKHLLGLWKSLRGGEGNIGHRLFRRTQNEPKRGNGQGTSRVSSNSSMLRLLGISKRTATNPMNLPKLGNVRIFTKGELSEVTENYSYLLGTCPCYEVYKGTLEDNTWVTVKKYCVINETTKEECSNAAIILSQIVHKNIIRLLGCCLEDNTLVLVCEYAAKGKLSDILDGGEDFPLELRLKIAAKTAEALEYLHEPATGVILHGSVMPSNIFLDDNFLPKVAGFENSRRLANVEDPAVSSMGNTNYIEPNVMLYDLIKTKSDVYYFGIVLLELINENKHAYHDQKRLLIPEFIKAYNTDKSGKAMFDQRITAEERHYGPR